MDSCGANSLPRLDKRAADVMRLGLRGVETGGVIIDKGEILVE